MTIGQPQVILHDVDGKPRTYESLVVDVPDRYASRVIGWLLKER